MAEFKLGRLKFVWKGAWTAGATYVKDDIIRFGGKTYVCVQGHVASGADEFYDDIANWSQMSDGQVWEGEWASETFYKLNDIVRFGAKSYICVLNHESTAGGQAGFYTDLAANKWELLSDGFRWRSAWNAFSPYALNDIVSFGGGTYICSTQHTSTGTFDETKWQVFNTAFEFESSWSDSEEYQAGDVVAYGGYTYYAVRRNTNVIPTSSLLDWKPFVEGLNFRGQYSDVTAYRVGDLIRDGGNLYLCIQDNTGANPWEIPSLYWQLYSEGINWVGAWTDGDVYKVGDAVKFGQNSYICIKYHTAVEATNSPANDITLEFWNALAEGSALTVLSTQGDIVYRSAVGASRLPIGSTDQVLVVSAGGEPVWSSTADISASTLTTTGSIVIDDAGDGGEIYIGDGAAEEVDGGTGDSGFTDAKSVIIADTPSFAQLAFKNKNAGTAASTDFIVYANNGDNDSGWIDMGITSSNFDATSGFGITDVNDGYIFMSAPAGTTGPGNLVIATNDTGTENDIVFCTGGFDVATNTDAEKMRIIGEARDGAMFTGAISGTTLTVTAVAMGTILADGKHTIYGTNVISGTTIVQQLTGTSGSTGTYRVNKQQTVVSTAMTQDLDAAGIEVKIDTASTNPYTGALRVEGGVGIQGDLDLEGTIEAYGGAIYQGTDGAITARMLTIDNTKYPGYVGLTNASGVFTGHANDFVQFALKNFNGGDSASTDIIAYSSNGDNDSGWIDMGITSEGFSDPEFGITGPSTGYIFMSAPAGTSSSGNLLVGTDETGTENDIIIFSGGFDAGNEKLRIVGTSRPGRDAGVEIYADTESTSTTTGALRVNGGIGLQGNMNVGGNVNIVGTITVGGAGSALETTTLAVSDPMIIMGSGNTTDLIDLGFYGIYGSSGTKHAGLVRDATDGKFKLFTGLSAVPTTTVNFAGATYSDIVMGGIESYGSISLTGGITANTNKFTVDGPTGNTSAAGTLSAGGDFAVAVNKFTANATTGNLSAAGSLTLGSGITVNTNKFTVDGSNGNIVTTGSLNITGGITLNTNKFTVDAANGNTVVAGTFQAATITETSSIALKQNIAPIENALDMIMQMTGVIYDRRDGSSKNEAGLIAEDVYKVSPNLVGLDKDGNPYSIQYTKIGVYLLEAIKTLKKEIDDIKNRI